MAEDVASPTRPGPSGPAKGNEAASSSFNAANPPRHRALGRASTFAEMSGSRDRRRSSMLSDFSLDDARNSIRSSTDDLLLPKPKSRPDLSHEPSVWHSSPLAFALLPALGGMIFTNGSAIVTDVTLLGLAAIFLNWSVRLPWDWYHSAQSVTTQNPFASDAVAEESEEEGEVASPGSEALSGDDGPAREPLRKPSHQPRPLESEANELRAHELLALASCFLFPLLGAYLLHTIRAQLSRPSEGLVSGYNLTIFILAAEVRPLAHLIKIIQSRTLFLQRVINENPFTNRPEQEKLIDLSKRLEDLETRSIADGSPMNGEGNSPNGKSAVTVTTEVRRTLQPDLDALNRAVRRYEKRATMQTMQTESRLQELEARLNDALSLAAAAAQSGQRQRPGFAAILVDSICAAVFFPLQAFWALLNLPIHAVFSVMAMVGAATGGRKKGRDRRSGVNRYNSHGRLGGERIQARGLRKS